MGASARWQLYPTAPGRRYCNFSLSWCTPKQDPGRDEQHAGNHHEFAEQAILFGQAITNSGLALLAGKNLFDFPADFRFWPPRLDFV